MTPDRSLENRSSFFFPGSAPAFHFIFSFVYFEPGTRDNCSCCIIFYRFSHNSRIVFVNRYLFRGYSITIKINLSLNTPNRIRTFHNCYASLDMYRRKAAVAISRTRDLSLVRYAFSYWWSRRALVAIQTVDFLRIWKKHNNMGHFSYFFLTKVR